MRRCDLFIDVMFAGCYDDVARLRLVGYGVNIVTVLTRYCELCTVIVAL